jgi:hypothetical protein
MAMRARLLLLGFALAGSGDGGRGGGGVIMGHLRPFNIWSVRRTPIVASSPSNPRRLRVAQWLGESRDRPAKGVRVRFEWDQVPGAHAYVLRGRWTSNESWAVLSAEHHVIPSNAMCWTPRRVEFDAELPHGSHSWRVIALFTPKDSGDFENATPLTFELH